MTDYILGPNRDIVEVSSSTWGEWFGKVDRSVALTKIPNKDLEVSTVFLGIEHGFDEQGRPLLFETMVFAGTTSSSVDGMCYRYATWDEAVEGHARTVEEYGG